MIPIILILPKSITNRLATHAADCYPRECCGFILGENCNAELYVDDILPVDNVASDIHRYEMAPESVLLANQAARSRNSEILAVYHSHPNGGDDLSDADRQETTPGVLQFVMSIAANGACQSAAWILTEDRRVESIAMITVTHA